MFRIIRPTSSVLKVSTTRCSFETRGQEQRGIRFLQSLSQLPSRGTSELKNVGTTSLSLAAIAGAAVLTIGLESQMESVAHTRAATMQSKWHLFDQIGSGAFGTVCLGMHEDSG